MQLSWIVCKDDASDKVFSFLLPPPLTLSFFTLQNKILNRRIKRFDKIKKLNEEKLNEHCIYKYKWIHLPFMLTISSRQLHILRNVFEMHGWNVEASHRKAFTLRKNYHCYQQFLPWSWMQLISPAMAKFFFSYCVTLKTRQESIEEKKVHFCLALN